MRQRARINRSTRPRPRLTGIVGNDTYTRSTQYERDDLEAYWGQELWTDDRIAEVERAVAEVSHSPEQTALDDQWRYFGLLDFRAKIAP
jgi:hypothetical protein